MSHAYLFSISMGLLAALYSWLELGEGVGWWYKIPLCLIAWFLAQTITEVILFGISLLFKKKTWKRKK